MSALDLEGQISVAEQAMERGGYTGQHHTVPKGHQDDPAYHAAIAPLQQRVTAFARSAGIEHSVPIRTNDYELSRAGNPQAMVTAMGSIVTRPQTNDMAILHEVAHIATHTQHGVGGHTPEFANTARDLYSRHISPEAGDAFWGVVGHHDLFNDRRTK